MPTPERPEHETWRRAPADCYFTTALYCHPEAAQTHKLVADGLEKVPRARAMPAGVDQLVAAANVYLLAMARIELGLDEEGGRDRDAVRAYLLAAVAAIRDGNP